MHDLRTLAARTAGLLSLFAVAGCLENSDSGRRHDDDYRRTPTYEPRYDEPRYREPPPPVVVYEPAPHSGWYDDNRYSNDRFDSDRKRRDLPAGANVPRGARPVAEAKGVIGYRAVKDGRVWITESEFDEVIWSGRVYTGEVVEVVPHKDHIFIDRHDVKKIKMKDNIKYRIFFDRER